MKDECAVCGAKHDLIWLEDDHVVDRRLKRKHKYRHLTICRDCWRRLKEEQACREYAETAGEVIAAWPRGE